ncbi:hypothetical protein BKA61DRAFT_719791 [Leptodontidium sp. MPI-SDFR-AT-0119]|nr:hypothetical protein BKA61DRAFT_719791 [Leptodontidium sp. MPI-SDFR-AT-0119]
MEATTYYPTTECAHCSKFANRFCSRCKDAPILSDGLRKAYYCSSACQRAHWETHKGDCTILKAGKTLYRAGDILQQLFYQYREKLFDRRLAKIENRCSKLYIYDRNFTDHELSKPLREDTITVSFPEMMYKTPEDKKAVLVHIACSDAIAFFHDLAGYLLSACVFHKDHDQKIVGITATGQVDGAQPHDIWIVTLKASGEKYAVDLTGAQFGYYEPVSPWDEFVANRVRTQGFHKVPLQFRLKTRVPNQATVAHSLNLMISKDLVDVVKTWEMGDGEERRPVKEMFSFQR